MNVFGKLANLAKTAALLLAVMTLGSDGAWAADSTINCSTNVLTPTDPASISDSDTTPDTNILTTSNAPIGTIVTIS